MPLRKRTGNRLDVKLNRTSRFCESFGVRPHGTYGVPLAFRAHAADKGSNRSAGDAEFVANVLREGPAKRGEPLGEISCATKPPQGAFDAVGPESDPDVRAPSACEPSHLARCVTDESRSQVFKDVQRVVGAMSSGRFKVVDKLETDLGPAVSPCVGGRPVVLLAPRKNLVRN